MEVLVDTSVWVAHFKQRNEHLAALLESGLVVCHPFVVVEVACGTPPRRAAVIDALSALDQAPVATPPELLALLQKKALYGRGCGFVDLSLLAATLLGNNLRLWTQDRRLQAVALSLGKAYAPPAPS